MRTTLDLDDDLLAALAERYPDLSKTEAIEAAVREHLRSEATRQLRERAGRYDIEDVSGTLRAREWTPTSIL